MCHSASYIKRKAKSISKEEGIIYARALDKSAVLCGYHNWEHFVNSIKADDSSSLLKNSQSNTMNPYRKLLVAAVNKLLSEKRISLDANNKKYSDAGYLITKLFGHTTVIIWADIGFEELSISVWWKYDHSLHPHANLTGSLRENFTSGKPLGKRQHYKKFVGVILCGWLERKEGKYVQREMNRTYKIYSRRGEKEELERIMDPVPLGFKSEGNFHR
ncbi:hypothetical protein GCM10009118_11720 [Wandonia haliotis]|uniref:Uncharacterized protein n=2 Tax=Wandonia haliotis TaxID=574963 RepID=A0ABP3Y3K5_9FLAO